MFLVKEPILSAVDHSIAIPNLLFCGNLYLFTGVIILLFSVCSISVYYCYLCSSTVSFKIFTFSSVVFKTIPRISCFIFVCVISLIL